jgi:signal transduction histidine kinase
MYGGRRSGDVHRRQRPRVETMSAAGVSAAGTPAQNRWLTWTVSALVVLGSLAGGLFLLYDVLRQGPSGLYRWLDVAVGAAGCTLLLLRRRRPTAVALILAVLASVVATAGAANMVALYALARQRRLGVAVGVAGVDVLAGMVFWWLYPNDRLSLTVVVNLAIAAAVVAWGSMRQTQQALVDLYRERAERAEGEQRLRADQARNAERTRIAREMHDAVAHRISLVALHAGGLAVATDLPSAEVRRTAELIRSAAVQGLEELRATLGVLRADERRSLEQPGLDRLNDLVRDARQAGQDVTLEFDRSTLDHAPASLGRDVYRIVQEGLTNARKHAVHAPTTATVSRVDDVVRVRVTNPVAADSLQLPASGSGLAGLAERTELAGGSLRFGRSAGGSFELVAELPWKGALP